MPFKKLHPTLQEMLSAHELNHPTPFQQRSIPVVKSGANTYGIARKGSGKTTALILTTLQKINCEAVGTTPRALVLVENKAKAMALYDAFLSYTRYTPIRVYVGHEKLDIEVQKSELFEGADILISTPKTMNKLFLLNGVSTSQLKICSIDDAEFLAQHTSYNAIMSITQSVYKCQYVLYAEEMHPMLKRFEGYFMERAKVVSI